MADTSLDDYILRKGESFRVQIGNPRAMQGDIASRLGAKHGGGRQKFAAQRGIAARLGGRQVNRVQGQKNQGGIASRLGNPQRNVNINQQQKSPQVQTNVKGNLASRLGVRFQKETTANTGAFKPTRVTMSGQNNQTGFDAREKIAASKRPLDARERLLGKSRGVDARSKIINIQTNKRTVDARSMINAKSNTSETQMVPTANVNPITRTISNNSNTNKVNVVKGKGLQITRTLNQNMEGNMVSEVQMSGNRLQITRSLGSVNTGGPGMGGVRNTGGLAMDGVRNTGSPGMGGVQNTGGPGMGDVRNTGGPGMGGFRNTGGGNFQITKNVSQSVSGVQQNMMMNAPQGPMFHVQNDQYQQWPPHQQIHHTHQPEQPMQQMHYQPQYVQPPQPPQPHYIQPQQPQQHQQPQYIQQPVPQQVSFLQREPQEEYYVEEEEEEEYEYEEEEEEEEPPPPPRRPPTVQTVVRRPQLAVTKTVVKKKPATVVRTKPQASSSTTAVATKRKPASSGPLKLAGSGPLKLAGSSSAKGKASVSTPEPVPVKRMKAEKPSTPAEEEESDIDVISPLQGYRVMVSNLHPIVTQDDIIELFGAIGPMKKAKLVKAGTAEVVYVNKDDALKGVQKYHNRELDGQPMQVKLLTSTTAQVKQVSDPVSSPKEQAEPLRLGKNSTGKKSAESVDIGLIHKALFKTGTPAPTKPVTFTVKI